MLVLVTYDIASDRTRLRLSQILEAHGTRVQLSVFECTLTARRLAALRRRLVRTFEAGADPEDSLRIYRLCARCLEHVEVIGAGGLTRDPVYFIA